jgi:hypothetical protein
MNCLILVLGIDLAIATLAAGAATQRPDSSKASSIQAKSSTPREFGRSYATLRPEQQKLVDDYARRYNTTTGSHGTSAELYDGARMSVRTTFDAVTHALLRTKLTNDKGQSLGRAIDLIEGLDEVAGEEEGVRGDRQFRLYVYLKPKAFETLDDSREFHREKDNTVYHKGFPFSFRLKKGPPSIQFSISRNQRMADIDVDYRSSTFPKALLNGHLTAANSDVRAGNNLDTHDGRWTGLTGWWREVFGFYIKNNEKPPKETDTGRGRVIPLNPGVNADQGIDASAHDFLKSWAVDKQPNQAVAYLSRRSYPCVEQMAAKNQKPIPPGMVRFRTMMAMDKFNASTGKVTSVEDVFEPDRAWSPELEEEKNAYSTEFRLVSVPSDMAEDEKCVPISGEESSKSSNEKFYATVFRGKLGDGRGKVMVLLWAKEGKYWKVVAMRLEDSGTSGLGPKKTAAVPLASVAGPTPIAGDPGAVRDITSFYEDWLVKRDVASAALYASKRSYACISPPSSAKEKKMTPAERIQYGLGKPLPKIPKGLALSDLMSEAQPVNELVRPVEHQYSKELAISAIPDQIADSFLCQQHSRSWKAQLLTPSDAKYGTYYLSASRLSYGEEESPAFLLLWAKENAQWKVIAWTIEVP